MTNTADPGASGSPGAARGLARMLLLGAVLLAAGLALRRLAPGLLATVRPSAAGALILTGGGAALTAMGVPRQAVAFAGGYTFGPLAGGALAMVAQLLGCAADYVAARWVAGSWARAQLDRSPNKLLGRTRKLLDAHPFTATVTLRLLPVSNNMLLNLLAGVAHVRPAPFLLGSALGYLPQTIIFALLGGGTQVGQGTTLALGAGLFVLSAALGVALLWRGGK